MHPYILSSAAGLTVWILAAQIFGWKTVLILAGLLALVLLGVAATAAFERRGQS
jgi:uncharacterized membrane protein